VRYDTSYLEFRQASWDCYIEVRGNRYSVPAEWAGQPLMVRIGLDDRLRVFHAEQLVAQHSLQSKQDGWCTVPEHHAALWEAVKVEPRALGVYEEVL